MSKQETIVTIALIGFYVLLLSYRLWCRYVGNNKEDDSDIDKDWWV